jgi:hypothetical protein
MKKKTPSSGHVNSAKEEVFEESLHFTATLVDCQLVSVVQLTKPQEIALKIMLMKLLYHA